MVRRARTHPCSTAVRSVLPPSRTSSRNRSKNTTKESAVIPMATMRPAIPASDSARCWYLPSAITDRYATRAAMIKLDTATMARPR